MGFYDLTGTVDGFGSVGLAIDAPTTQLALSLSEYAAYAHNSADVVEITQHFINVLNIKQYFSLDMRQAIPRHVGLGSGTQLALAIGSGLNALLDLGLTNPQIARVANRGSRSGIGLAAFSQGGFLVDAGRVDGALPQVAFRADFPKNWRVILVSDSTHVGVHGAAESQAFDILKPMKESLKNMALNYLTDAVQRADLLAFGAYMVDLQAYNGAYFSPVQGGLYASEDVKNALNWLQQNGVACVGQSSWGPTGFAVIESPEQAENLLKQVKLAFADRLNLSFTQCSAKNTGVELQIN